MSFSSDGGHYYTYARKPRTFVDDENGEPAAENDEESGLRSDDTWYIFNDSKVSYRWDAHVKTTCWESLTTCFLFFAVRSKTLKTWRNGSRATSRTNSFTKDWDRIRENSTSRQSLKEIRIPLGRRPPPPRPRRASWKRNLWGQTWRWTSIRTTWASYGESRFTEIFLIINFYCIFHGIKMSYSSKTTFDIRFKQFTGQLSEFLQFSYVPNVAPPELQHDFEFFIKPFSNSISSRLKSSDPR